MSVPQNLQAFDGKVADYEWTPTHVANMPASPETISGDELAARMKIYVEKLLADPEWHAQNERKAAEKAARHEARLERIAERRKRKMEKTK